MTATDTAADIAMGGDDLWNPRTRNDLLVIDLNAPMGLMPSACLTFDVEEAKAMMITVGQWLIQYGHLPAPIVIDYKEGRRP